MFVEQAGCVAGRLGLSDPEGNRDRNDWSGTIDQQSLYYSTGEVQR